MHCAPMIWQIVFYQENAAILGSQAHLSNKKNVYLKNLYKVNLIV
jgi:hypothetical protein